MFCAAIVGHLPRRARHERPSVTPWGMSSAMLSLYVVRGVTDAMRAVLDRDGCRMPSTLSFEAP